ncbi:sex peptide receptor-like [Saccostrea cucullata]|uniref:sex peptide receptor-like n=1 Tax=Saccostrea cuccullata TaxID=36930 RepID=UPI002ED287A4
MMTSAKFEISNNFTALVAYDHTEKMFNRSNGNNASTPGNGMGYEDILPIMNPGQSYIVPINGIVSIIFILVTIVTNILVMLVLLRKHMRSPTNIILAAMALADMLTGLFPLPMYFYFFTLGNYVEYPPYDWCYVYKLFTEYLPMIFHTASIWLTVFLAILRYIYVCHTDVARKVCTVPNVIRATVGIYVVATLTQTTRFIESESIPHSIPSKRSPNKTITTCLFPYRPFVQEDLDLYFNLIFGFRVIFIHFIPCSLLLILNALLIRTMRQAQLRRRLLLRQNKKNESKKLADSNCTTLMLVAVLGLFLLVELPLGVIMILFSIQNTLDIHISETSNFLLMTAVSNTAILVSYPLNFLIYCAMSRQFRETFKRIFTCKPMPLQRECSHYTAVPQENGKMHQEDNKTNVVEISEYKKNG